MTTLVGNRRTCRSRFRRRPRADLDQRRRRRSEHIARSADGQPIARGTSGDYDIAGDSVVVAPASQHAPLGTCSLRKA
jgi:hypothetical protein